MIPTPMAKNTTSGINLYAVFVIIETPGRIDADKSTPMIKNINESACLIPCLEDTNNQTVTGSRKIKINTSC